jgi:pSer/pThr/pTyr-binding forkhead associated (FHA) protein
MVAAVCGILLVIAGPGRGMAIPISYGRNSVGAGDSARVRLDLGDPQMSAVHCIVSYDHEDRQFDVREADGATNFTRVNGARIGAAHVLKTGDIIKLGGTELRFVEICGSSWDWGDDALIGA